MKHDIAKLRKNGITKETKIEHLTTDDGKTLLENMKKYQPKKDVLDTLEEKAKGFIFVVFSAAWCKDCKVNVAAFLKILELKPSIDAIFFENIKTAPKNPDIRWRVPPSPEEVNEFDLRRIPTIYILNQKGEVVGEFLENPATKETVEEELVYLLDNT